MKNSSDGYHTFSFCQKINSIDFPTLESKFEEYISKNEDFDRYPIKNNVGKQLGWGYYFKNNKGIRWHLLSFKAENGFYWHGLITIINPKALVEREYIVAANENNLTAVEEIYNSKASKISSLLSKYGESSVNRIDFCVNIDLRELGINCSPEQMIELIRQGNIPNHYKELTKYDKTSHRNKAYKNSFYLKSKSVNINYYCKHSQQHDRHPNYLLRELSRNVIRFEVQYKYPKLYPLAQDKREESKYTTRLKVFNCESSDEVDLSEIVGPSIPVDVVLTNKNAEKINEKYFFKVVRKGDYFTYDIAREIIQSYDFRQDKEDRLLYALETIKKHHGIAKAKSKLHGPDLDDFKKSLKDLDSLLINPVTIPRRWGIKHIPNLLRVYQEMNYDEELITKQEYISQKHIEMVLMEKRDY